MNTVHLSGILATFFVVVLATSIGPSAALANPSFDDQPVLNPSSLPVSWSLESVPRKLLLRHLLEVSPDRLVERLRQLVQDGAEISAQSVKSEEFDVVIQSLQFRIILEANQVLQEKANGGSISQEEMVSSLPTLQSLVKAKLRVYSVLDPIIADRLIDLVARLKAFADHDVPAIRSLFPGNSVPAKLRLHFKDRLGEFVEQAFGLQNQRWSRFGESKDAGGDSEAQSSPDQANRVQAQTGFLLDLADQFEDAFAGDDHGYSDALVNNTLIDLVKAYRVQWKGLRQERVVFELVPKELYALNTVNSCMFWLRPTQ